MKYIFLLFLWLITRKVQSACFILDSEKLGDSVKGKSQYTCYINPSIKNAKPTV